MCKTTVSQYHSFVSLQRSLDIHIIHWQSPINTSIGVRVGYVEGGSRGLNKDMLWMAVQRSRLQENRVKERMEGSHWSIDPQSQSSGLHVSRCQVSAIGRPWKMSCVPPSWNSIDSGVFVHTAEGQGSIDSRPPWQKWLRGPSVCTFVYNWEALLHMMYAQSAIEHSTLNLLYSLSKTWCLYL